tara:strand:- start:566 stop:1003 length:438 start_codon:yes stop_codon:yes gene_type:complete
MKKFEVIDYLMIFAIIFFMFIGTISVMAQNKDMGFYSSNENIYGTWSSWDGSTILYMNYNDNGDTFYRISNIAGEREVAVGKFTVREEFIYVEKADEKYRLSFFLKGMQMVVMKPASALGEAQAWLFRKVSDYGLEPISVDPTIE